MYVFVFMEGLMQNESEEEPTTIRSSMFTIFRGETFASNLSKLMASKQVLKNLNELSQRTCQLDVNLVSYRTLHHWDSMGLIECGRESSKSGWRKFNLVEVLWLNVIIKFRDLGISLEKIRDAKTLFFEKIPGIELKYVEYYLVGALYFKQPSFFVMHSDYGSEFLSYEELTSAMEVGLLNNAVLIHLNPLLNKIFKKIEVGSNFSFKRPVTNDQNIVCAFMNQEDFDSMKFIKANGKITEMEFEKGFSAKVPYREIIKDETDVLVTTKISNSLVVSTKRTKKIKLDNKEDFINA
ncbi:MAG: MerR family transcriptional regulator [Microcystis sp. M54BS1]|nr:MerR family transcriptional regulator [Microcystis sp. M54BS1]